jgi:curved DNA-binding protein CbpA
MSPSTTTATTTRIGSLFDTRRHFKAGTLAMSLVCLLIAAPAALGFVSQHSASTLSCKPRFSSLSTLRAPTSLHVSSTQSDYTTAKSRRTTTTSFANDTAIEPRRTLYEILGAPSNSTRQELKQAYLALAKESHPDAMIQRNHYKASRNDTSIDTPPDFTEIAAAWRILSDPKQRLRYDRSLQAEQFTLDVQEWASRVSQQAGPTLRQFGQVALPFLKRTTAATLASIQAAANDLTKKQGDWINESEVKSDGAAVNGVGASNNGASTTRVNSLYEPPAVYNEQQVSIEEPVMMKVEPPVVTKEPEPIRETQNSISSLYSPPSSSVQASKPMSSPSTVSAKSSVPPAAASANTPNPPASTSSPLFTGTLPSQQRTSLNSAFRSAMEAARKAGRYVDALELQEKAQWLEERAMEESEKAAEMENELQTVSERRLIMALHTPGSGLTSAEAWLLWQEFNQTVGDTLTAWDRALMRHTIEYEIDELKQCEAIFMDAQTQDSEAQLQYQICMQAKLQAKQELINADHAEVAARKELERAIQALATARSNVDEAAREMVHAEAYARKCDYEMERRSLSLVRQSEKVRNALRSKEKECMKHQQHSDDVQESEPGYFNSQLFNSNEMREYGVIDLDDERLADQVSAERLKELKELRREERLLAQKSARLENKAARLLSRANKLRLRADELEKMEKS